MIHSEMHYKESKNFRILENDNSTVEPRNSVQLGNPEIVRYSGVLRYFASDIFLNKKAI